MATLEQFLQTGALGPLHPGMSRSEVIAVLGPPPDESVAKHPQVLKYGGLQLTFLRLWGAQDQVLAHIGLYFAPQAEPIPEPVLPSDFVVTRDTTVAEVRAFLTRRVSRQPPSGWEESVVVEGEETNCLILPAGARITFDGRQLQSIIFASKASAPGKKQISISIPEETWMQLRSLARQSKRSVSELCSEWITQRANEPPHAKVGRPA